MPTITVPRTDLSTEELVTVLRDGLWSAPATTRVQAQVTITSPGGQTKLRIHPSGITVTLVLNTFGIVRTVREVLASRPSAAPQWVGRR